MNKILIVVDMQNDFITGALGSPQARAIVPNVVARAKRAHDEGDIVICTMDKHVYNNDYCDSLEGKYVPLHCQQGTWGEQILPEIQFFADFLAYKSTYAYQFWGDWHNMLDQVTSIELVGVCTDICVISNALALRGRYPNIPIIVDASCCAGLTPEKHAAALEVMKSCNVEVINE